MRDGSPVVVGPDGLSALLDILRERGMEVLGPVVRDGVISVGPIASLDDLPTGLRDEQGPARYQLDHGTEPTRFSWAVGPQTWKPILHPAAVHTLTMTQHGRHEAVHVEVRKSTDPRRALIGVRPCELAAIERLDHVLRTDDHPEPVYDERRRNVFVVVVDCLHPADTCFCTSMGTGPAAPENSAVIDIRVTEMLDASLLPRYDLVAVSEEGHEVVAELTERAAVRPATDEEVDARDRALLDAASAVRRRVDDERLRDLMVGAHADPLWDEIADRCLACGNCTAVCPTCFCTANDDVVDLSGEVTERWRRWDTCFSLEFSRVGDEPVRRTVASRYRHWLVHKLGTWHDQFGESGCVGCGRCITWCPVGIDLTEETDRLRHRRGEPDRGRGLEVV